MGTDRTRKRDGAALVAAGVCAVVVLGAVAIAAWQASDARVFLAHAVVATGLVTATPYGGFHPEIRLSLPSGETVDYQQNGFFFRGHHVGDRVVVLYDPADPRGSARLRNFGGVWGEAAFSAAFGLAFLFFGALLLFQGLTGRQILHLAGRHR